MKSPLVSVVMAVYRETNEQITAAVNDTLNQTHNDLELVVVLDDPQNERAKQLLTEFQSRDERVVLVENEQNLKLGGALNRGIEKARGMYIARMDADDRCPFPERLSKQLEYMRKHPDTDLLFTWWQEEDEVGNMVGRKPDPRDFAHIKKKFFVKSMLLHPTLLVHKRLFEKHKYPETKRPEDFPLFLKLMRKGFVFAVVPEVLYTYRVNRIDLRARYTKIRTYSGTLLGALMRELPYYWYNPFFWLYVGRVCAEFLMSRNFVIFKYTHKSLASVWKKVFNSA